MMEVVVWQNNGLSLLRVKESKLQPTPPWEINCKCQHFKKAPDGAFFICKSNLL